MTHHDEPLDPASEDEDVQSFIDGAWRTAITSARDTIEQLRMIVPEMVGHLEETSYRQIVVALQGSQDAYEALHRAGPFVLGQTDYDAFLQAQTNRTIGR